MRLGDLTMTKGGIDAVRGWRSQVLSGFRLAAKMVLVLLVFCSLGGGLRLMTIGNGRALVLGTGIVLVTDGFLFVTAARWAKWFCAACGANILRLLVMAALGGTISVPSIAAPRIFFVELIAVAAVMCLLTYRFMLTKPTRLDSVALVGALTALVYSLFGRASMSWVLLAILLLGIAFAVNSIRNRLPKRRGGWTNLPA